MVTVLILLVQFISILLDACTYIRAVDNLCISITRSNSRHLIGVVCSRAAVAGITICRDCPSIQAGRVCTWANGELCYSAYVRLFNDVVVNYTLP
jgi:hypothetical protein